MAKRGVTGDTPRAMQLAARLLMAGHTAPPARDSLLDLRLRRDDPARIVDLAYALVAEVEAAAAPGGGGTER
ncbi:MAG TPA: hypothetical protein VFL91_08410 [Thermomicrobiales bacterium]|nr:hypothetical protein [Thermomicrobiales bacterium]